jgi:hypothetical protein
VIKKIWKYKSNHIIFVFSKQQQMLTKIKRFKTLYRFNQLRKKLAEIHTINCGGCAIAAYVMYMWLKQRGINCDIIYLYSSWCCEGYGYNNDYMNNNRTHAYGCGHAGIVLEGEIMDSLPKFNYYYNLSHIVSPQLVLDSLVHSGWNPDFDRNKWLPHIEKISGIKVPIQK